MLNSTEMATWQDDLRFMAAELPKRHANLFHTITRTQFKQAVAALEESIPALARHQIIVELARIVALIGDGHTSIDMLDDPTIDFRRYPLRLYQYSDGLFIQAASADYAEAAGSRVIAIGDIPVEQVYAAVRRLVSRENELRVVHKVPDLLVIPEVLHAVHLITHMEQVDWCVERRDGERRTIRVNPVRRGEALIWTDASDNIAGATPLWRKDLQNKFWFEHLADARAIYVQFNSVRDKPDETIAAFFGQVFDFVDDHHPDRFILDIRLNGGGNGTLNQPIVHGLIKRDWLNQRGKLFTIIGRATFSAAMMLAVDLERHTRALFVGEPTGTSPNMYGETGIITLPNSRLTVYVSELHWVYSDPRDQRPWITPNIRAELSSTDYRAKRDPAIDAILGYVPNPSDIVDYPERLTRALQGPV
jgi:hypothetical protein